VGRPHQQQQWAYSGDGKARAAERRFSIINRRADGTTRRAAAAAAAAAY